MNTRKIITTGTAALLAITMAVTACRKQQNNNDSTTTEDTEYADDIARMEQVFGESDQFADQAIESGEVQLKGGPGPLGPCATVTKDTVGTPDSITIDFGPTNCLCKDGRFRRGQIIIAQTGHYKDSGFTRIITFHNYYVNDNHVYGSRSVANMGKNASGHLYYQVNVNGYLVSKVTNDTASHVTSRTRTFMSGQNTTQVSDDAYAVTGSGTHTRLSGKVYTMNITSPLHLAMNCNWIKAGTIAITPQGATNPRILDYGNGTCDDKATITVNGNTKNIILK